MYTIIRFIVDKDKILLLDQIGLSMNKLKDNVYSGIRRAGDGFTCELSSDLDWDLHRKSIIEFLKIFFHQVAEINQLPGAVTVDVAIEPEDIQNIPKVLHCDLELLSMLVSCGVKLELSIY